MPESTGNHSPQRPGLGITLMLVSAICFATMGACLKEGLKELPYIEGVFFRSVVSAIILGVVVWRKRLPFMGNARKILFSRSLTGFLSMNCGFYALTQIPLADAQILHQTAPVFVALFSVIFLGERLVASLVVLLGLAFFGVGLVIQPSFEVFNIPGFIGLLGGAFAGLAYVHVRHLHRTDNTWVIAFHFTSFSTLASLPMMLYVFAVPTAGDLILLLSAGVLGTGGQYFMTAAYQHDQASRLAPYAYSGVLVAFLYGLFFFGERPNAISLFGICIVCLAGILLYRVRKTPPSDVSAKSD